MLLGSIDMEIDLVINSDFQLILVIRLEGLCICCDDRAPSTNGSLAFGKEVRTKISNYF